MKCNKCHHDLAEDAKFCNKCGAEVKEQKIHCEKCNHALSKDDKFCEKCGEKVHNKVEVKEENHAIQKKTTESATKKKGNKGLIALVIGVVVLAVIILAVVNLKDTDDDHEAEAKNTEENEVEEYSIEELAEQYGIEEDLLTYEEMDEVVTRIENETEESLEYTEIKEIIEEDYGMYNARAYEEGLLIDKDMSETDKHQVMMGLSNTPMKPVKNIRKGVQFAFEKSDKNELKKIKDLYEGELVGYFKDTEGFYDVGGINVGYLNVLPKETVYNNDKSFVKVEMYIIIGESFEYKDILKYMENIEDLKINGEVLVNHIVTTSAVPFIPNVTEQDKEYGISTEKEKFDMLYGMYGDYVVQKNAIIKIETLLPVERVLGDGVTSFDDYDKNTLKIDFNGKDFELSLNKDEEYLEIPVNPEIK